MDSNTASKFRLLTKGFELVELMVVIAIIGAIAALAIPGLTRIHDAGESAKRQKNAQNIASQYLSARAAGATFDADPVAGPARDLDQIFRRLHQGVQGGGQFCEVTFRVALSESEWDETRKFLSYDPSADQISVLRKD